MSYWPSQTKLHWKLPPALMTPNCNKLVEPSTLCLGSRVFISVRPKWPINFGLAKPKTLGTKFVLDLVHFGDVGPFQFHLANIVLWFINCV